MDRATVQMYHFLTRPFSYRYHRKVWESCCHEKEQCVLLKSNFESESDIGNDEFEKGTAPQRFERVSGELCPAADLYTRWGHVTRRVTWQETRTNRASGIRNRQKGARIFCSVSRMIHSEKRYEMFLYFFRDFSNCWIQYESISFISCLFLYSIFHSLLYYDVIV